jgi:phosphoenolpyruvate carboxykinase (ATP)
MTTEVEAKTMTDYVNLTRAQLVTAALERNEGVLASNGALTTQTGARTGRSTKDRFIVKDAMTEAAVNWGDVNQPISADVFDALWEKAEHTLAGKDRFISDLQVGADAQHALSVRVTTEFAWHNLFCQNLFIKSDQARNADTGWNLLSAPSLTTDPQEDGVHGDATLIINFSKRAVLLCGLRYAGEMKKAMFSVMNFLMPPVDVLPMHCAANAGKNGDTALFFGLSGTGKTTLSADPERLLIGDDEHGWSADGVFNFEGGCYAKCIDLSEKNEPVIFKAIKDNAIMENVVLDKVTIQPDYRDDRLTQNTRAAYPRDHIDLRVPDNCGKNPSVVLFLTCDLYGVLPPVAKLSPEQAAYHFLSGYTALVGSTEMGGGSGVKPTFSACFGKPFFARHPQVYADLLIKRLAQTGAEVYLVNTGWTGGAYGKGGARFAIPTTRAVVSAIVRDELRHAEYQILPGFNLAIPTAVNGVDTDCLDPRKGWSSEQAYNESLNTLITQFSENFLQFNVTENILQAGPEKIGN